MKAQHSIDVEKVRQGDPEAFKEFFVCFYPKMKALACRFVDEKTAEDMVQDVFTSYWECKGHIQADNIYSFLFKWLQNNCLNYLRHQAVTEDYEVRVRLAEERMSYWERNTDFNEILQRLMNEDLHKIIEQSVRKLPPKCAEAFRLCYFKDMNRKEIAIAMSISPRTVECHIHSALIFLRADLKKILAIIFMFCNIN